MTRSRPRHAVAHTNVPGNAAPARAVTGSAAPATAAGVEVDGLLGTAAVARGEITATVTIAVHGDIDAIALDRVREVLETLITTRTLVVADLYRAHCGTGRLLAELVNFRARRQHGGLETQFHGLHPGVIPDLEAADLTEVFSAYQDAHRTRHHQHRGLAPDS